MLPKVSAALSRFITPIVSSAKKSEQTPLQERENRKEFQRFKPELKLVDQPIEPEARAASDQTNLPAPLSKNASLQKVGSPFLALIMGLQNQRNTVFRWLGLKRYAGLAKSLKKSHGFKRGTMLDQKVE